MRIVIALGGNALLKRGEPQGATELIANVGDAARAIAEVGRKGHELVITHGNGPQIGLLELRAEAYADVPPFPLDILGAESQGQIGYLIQREPRERNATPHHRDGIDPGAGRPNGFGICDADETDWAMLRPGDRVPILRPPAAGTMVPDGNHLRRAVPSPTPREIIELGSIRLLVDAGVTVIAAGGGGIPVAQDAIGGFRGVEAVVDKDRTAGLLAKELNADHLLLLTDAESVLTNWSQGTGRSIRRATPWQLSKFEFDPGSMGPKVRAACNFVRETRGVASIGALTDAAAILEGRAGTTIHSQSEPLTFAA